MPDEAINSESLQTAFAAYERRIRIANYKLGCVMAFIFVPAGASLDYFVYPTHLREFFIVRLICDVFLAAVWFLLQSEIGIRVYRFLGFMVAFLPMAFISWMIYRTNGGNSPYYAGLNLVMLGAAILLRWTFWDSVFVFAFSLATYLTACFFCERPNSTGTFFNNIYFLVVTGFFIGAGSWFYNRIRFSEFALRYELDEKKRDLEYTNRKLIELDKLKSRFFANISHEMRTPLTLLISPLESLMRRFDGAFDSGAREMLVTMQNNSMRLLKLINDLLDLIRLEAGRMDIKSDPLVVTEFFRGLASAIRQLAADKKIQFETRVSEQLDMVLTDRDKVEKILLNLLFNALKFTPAGGRVELRAEKQFSKAESENGKTEEQFVLIVSDTGIGIAEKSLPFVFDRFWQADNSSRRKFQGVGIGLALVKELAEMMRGGVTVESVEGKGATFTVRLPYKKVDELAEHKTVEPAPSENGKTENGEDSEWLANLYRRVEFFPAASVTRETSKPAVLTGRKPVVLVADDEPDMRRFLKAELEQDYDLIEANDGVQALEKTEMLSPDIVLLDMMMPEMDGLDVCRALRQNEATKNLPIILLTARADEETKFDALQMGANDFLAKPFSANELHARVKNLVESHFHQRKLSKQNVALTSAIEQIKETEMQLVQSEKLASLGRMSAGIIHEINNPLNFATTGLFALRNKGKNLGAKERAEFNEILNDVEEGVKRVRNIVSDLRVFTHPESGPPEIVDVAEAVSASLRFLASEWKSKVKIENKIVPGQVAQTNRNKLVHVLVNLLQNSLDALRHKKYDNGEQPEIRIEGRIDEGKSFIIVRDNGMGIEQKNLAKIFDPFFTTKDVGEGMGLGLSIVHRIVRGYGGHINVKSEPGKFCEFIFDFPEKARSRKPELVEAKSL